MENVVPYTSSSTAAARARDRRKWVLKSLDEFRAELPRHEVIENPPGIESAQPETAPSETEGFGQLARLSWQLRRDVTLLAERAADLLLGDPTIREFPEAISAIRVLPVDLWKRRRGQYNWRVVINTLKPSLVADTLQRQPDWLGIGVDVDDDVNIKPLGRCTSEYGGMAGMVGGLVQAAAGTYAMTCRHVVVAQCRSTARNLPQVPNGALGPVTSSPDFVLLDTMTPCFRCPEIGAAAAVATPHAAGFETLIDERTTVQMNHPECSRSPGVVKSGVQGIRIGGRMERFPCLEIIPRVDAYLFGLWRNPLRRKFIQEGCSGAWVTEDATATWVGMVAGGDDRGSTYALEANALSEYVSRLIGWPQSTPTVMLTWKR